MIYTTGTIAISGNTVTGTGTNFSAPLSLIRVGCTLIAVGNPVQIFTITEIKSGTELSVTPAANPAIPAGTKFSILLSDSISVDGLAQDVAETLRYYQGKETEIAAAVEWWEDFGGDGQMDQLLANIRAETAKSTANAQKTESDKNAAEASKTAAAKSATAAKTSETNAKKSETAAKTSETNAKTSENRAQEYLNQMGRLTSPMVQCAWPVETSGNGAYVKIAKLSDPKSSDCHLTLMVTNGGGYGLSYGNIDFIEISARGLNDTGEVTSENISKFLSIRRLGSPNLPNNSQMCYGLVKGDGYIEVWCYQRSYIKNTKVAVLAQTGSTELYIPEGFVEQAAAPAGYIESPAARIYDQVNKPSKADLGLSNAMLTGAFGLGGSGIATNGKMSNTELLKALRDKGGHFWRADKPTESTATHYTHGSSVFSRCGDTWSAINIEYEKARVKIFAGNDTGLNSGTYAINELYGTQNKPSKSDVGLGNVTNDAQVKKAGDIMSGDLAIYKATPSLSLRAKGGEGAAAVRFYTDQNQERGIIYAGQNTDTLGEVHIRAKNTKGESSGDFIVRHDGRVEARDLKITYKISGSTAELANASTNGADTTLKISGAQHTPLVLARTDTFKNLSIGFKVNSIEQKYLGIDDTGDLAFGGNADQKLNSKVITQAILDSGVTVGGKTTFSDLATFNAGVAGSIEPETIDNKTIDLNDLIIANTEAGSVKYYQCKTVAGGAYITNKPDGVSGNFLLRVESTRKTTGQDYAIMQTLIGSDTKRIYVRFAVNGNWTEWSQVVVSGWNQDVTVKSLATQKVILGNVTLRGINNDEGTGIGVVFDGSNSTENTFGIVNTGGGSAVFHNYAKPADSSAVNTGVLIGGYGSRPWTGSTYTEHSNVSQHFLMDGVASATNHGGWFRLLTTPLNATVDERRQTFATSNNGDLYIGYDVPMGTYKLDAANYNGMDTLNGRGLKQVNNSVNEIALITPRNGSTASLNFRGVAFDGTMTGTKGATQQGDNLWLSFAGHDGVKFTGAAAGIRMQASTGWSTTSTQCGITFATTAQGSTTRVDRWAITSDGTLSPAQDGTYAIGSSASRVTSIFATNGAIQTSDARLKTDVRKMSDAELSAAKDIAREFGLFQWIERVKTEGESARWHTGITAQRVISIMESHGLNPMAYGFVCYDSWEEQEVVSVDPDNQSRTITKIEAGDRYSLRYEELSIFIARGLEQRISELEEKLL
ncbi:tail fiber domain-containing protein [Escherichia coli]|uniref:tail fiber domain-containing protein n=1 Tax=Escherichia coli TaxID=562 RepID=UPI00191C0F10|nr:tail fiber domain-containing protein [Escherichia coli]